MEAWFSLQDFPGYSVSSYGRVRNDKFDRVLTVLTNRHGVAMVGMIRNGKQAKASLGRLVAKVFVRPPQYQTEFDTVIHLDGDSMNNCSSNLMWRPFWFANIYKRQFKVDWDDTPPLRDRNTGEEYADVWDAVVRNGLLYRDVVSCTHHQLPVFPTSQRFEWVIQK